MLLKQSNKVDKEMHWKVFKKKVYKSGFYDILASNLQKGKDILAKM